MLALRDGPRADGALYASAGEGANTSRGDYGQVGNTDPSYSAITPLNPCGDPPGGVGTYTLDSSCEGTLTFTNGPSYNIFVGPSGKHVWMIQTDANTVFEGTVTKVSR